MRDVLRDPEQMRACLQRKVLSSAICSVARLARAARGLRPFDNDLEFKSCVALARLVPALFGPATIQDDVLFDDEHWTPERLDDLEKFFEAEQKTTREQCADEWAEVFRKDGAWGERFSTEEEAREYGRRQFDHCRASAANVQRQSRKSEMDAARKRLNRRRRI